MRSLIRSRDRAPLLIAGLALLTGLGVVALGASVLAQDGPTAEGASEAPAKHAAKPKKHGAPKVRDAETPRGGTARAHGARDEIAAAAPGAPDAPTAPSTAPPAAPPAATAPFDFAAQLDRAGAATCHAPINALATSTMGGVETFNTVSSWSQAAGDRRAVSLAIGQRYAAGSAVPFGASQIFAAPAPQGGCDGFTVQVLPSPLSCAKLRDSIAAQQGRQIGDLAGVAVMQDAAVRTMLVPAANNACVMVATTSFYAKERP